MRARSFSFVELSEDGDECVKAELYFGLVFCCVSCGVGGVVVDSSSLGWVKVNGGCVRPSTYSNCYWTLRRIRTNIHAILIPHCS